MPDFQLTHELMDTSYGTSDFASRFADNMPIRHDARVQKISPFNRKPSRNISFYPISSDARVLIVTANKAVRNDPALRPIGTRCDYGPFYGGHAFREALLCHPSPSPPPPLPHASSRARGS